MRQDFDIVIVGSGFGGTLLAMIARRLDLTVAVVEKGTHPRFAIGESTSPLMNVLIEQLAHRYDLPRLLPLTSYGFWKRTYPEIVCGLKRGFTYFHHVADRRFFPDPGHERQLLVAANPNDELADTHWLRSSVDHFLLNEALALGIEYIDDAVLNGVTWGTNAAKLSGNSHGRVFAVTGTLLIDATGPRGFLSRDLPATMFPGYPGTQSLYSHFTGVRRCDTMDAFQSASSPPYPMDDAALHHLFDGGWMWVLRFDNGVTSAGIAVEDWLANELALAEGEPAWYRFLARFPTIAEQFADAIAIRPFSYGSHLSYRCGMASSACAEELWALLPSAMAFVDPLFSTGMPLTLLGIERLATILETSWGTPQFAADLARYGTTTLEEADWTAMFIRACYAALPCFETFSTFSMFYFAAASFSEMARRLNTRQVKRYLAADHPQFAPGLQACANEIFDAQASRGKIQLPDFAWRVADRVDCINIAGLCDPSKQNWYGVDLNDVVVASGKLGFARDELERIIQTAPWAQCLF